MGDWSYFTLLIGVITPFISGRGPTLYQPKHCTIIMEIHQNYHKIVLFDSPKWVIYTPEN